jgi:hypothetical protein
MSQPILDVFNDVGGGRCVMRIVAVGNGFKAAFPNGDPKTEGGIAPKGR